MNVTFIHKILAFPELKISRYDFLFRTEIWLEFHFESAAEGLSLQNATDNNLLINFSNQAPGLYILNFKSKDTLVKIKFTKK